MSTDWEMKSALFQNVVVGATKTLTANSQLVVEVTSNTLLTFKLKGTDGATRTATPSINLNRSIHHGIYNRAYNPWPHLLGNTVNIQLHIHNWTVSATIRAWGPSCTGCRDRAHRGMIMLQSLLRSFDLTAANPIAYAYAQLEASGEFPEATWNI